MGNSTPIEPITVNPEVVVFDDDSEAVSPAVGAATFVPDAHRVLAVRAEFMFEHFKTVAHGKPFIEDEARALPAAFRFRYSLQVVQYPASKVMDLLDTTFLEECG